MKLSHLNPWLVMPALILFMYGFFLTAQWPLAGEHLFGYISFNNKNINIAESSIPQQYISSAFGYDGQFYYRLALNPFSNEEYVQGIGFDHPPWRQQRILLPVLTWSIARGAPQLTATVMLAINLLSIVGLTLAGAAILRHQGLSPWPAVLLAFYPGFAISVERFLTEPLSCLLLVLSLLSLAHKRVVLGGVILALAVLARETALAAALAMAGIWFLQTILRMKFDQWKAPGPAFWMPAIVTYISWQTWLQHNWAASAYSAAEKGNLLGWPLAGIGTSFWKLVSNISPDNIFFLFMMLALITWAVLVALLFQRSRGPYRWMWLAFLALATLLGPPIWNNSPGFMRTMTELNVLGMLIYLLAVQKPHRLVLFAWLGCWLLTAGAEGYRLHLIEQAKIITGNQSVVSQEQKRRLSKTATKAVLNTICQPSVSREWCPQPRVDS